jgi:hypothetical protein
LNREPEFERDFYSQYPLKRDRFRAEAFWKTMKERDKVGAITYLKKWKHRCATETHIQVRYPEQYLKTQPWND